MYDERGLLTVRIEAAEEELQHAQRALESLEELERPARQLAKLGFDLRRLGDDLSAAWERVATNAGGAVSDAGNRLLTEAIHDFSDWKKKAERRFTEMSAVLRSLDRIGPPRLDARSVSVRVRDFNSQLDRRRSALWQISNDLSSGERTLGDCWADFGTWEGEEELLLRQALSWLQGVLMRDNAVLAAVPEVADELLYELSRHSVQTRSLPPALVASDEHVDTVAGSVRLRFTDASVWTLPIAAHEFCHYALAQQRDLGGRIAEAAVAAGYADSANRTVRAHLVEHFCDSFATWMVGPAYPFACVYLRFNPAEADYDTLTHPSALKRVHLMLRLLRRLEHAHVQPTAVRERRQSRPVTRQDLLNEAYIRDIPRVSRLNKSELARVLQEHREADPPVPAPTSLADEADTLHEGWAKALVAANARSSRLDQRSARQLERLADEFARLMTRAFLSDMPYDGWARCPQFLPFLEGRQTLERAAWAARETAAAWDVVNAAWLCRLRTETSDHRGVGERALDLMSDIAQERLRDRTPRSAPTPPPGT
jgi:hypothetical protein